MQELAPLAGIVGTLAIGAVSPGPSFVMVATVAISSSRTRGLAAALGMGVGGVVFALAALLGLHAILLALPILYVGLKVLGGLYLCWLGYLSFARAKEPFRVEPTGGLEHASSYRAFLLGLTTQLSNPKTVIVYTGVFAAFLSETFPAPLALGLVCVVFVVEAGWYSIVAVALSSERPRRAYLNRKVSIDRTVGVVMVGLGLELVASTLPGPGGMRSRPFH